jgi:DNA-binding YbaB/EbfC family protein
MQQEMTRIQVELAATIVDGSAGGGVVTATVTGKQELLSVTIEPSAVDPDDVEMLQDLVVAAVNDALRASREVAEQKMSAVTGGLRLPGM